MTDRVARHIADQLAADRMAATGAPVVYGPEPEPSVWTSAQRDPSGASIGNRPVEHISTDETIRRMRLARAAQLRLVRDEIAAGDIDPLGAARRKVALRVNSGRGALARRLRYHGPRAFWRRVVWLWS